MGLGGGTGGTRLGTIAKRRYNQGSALGAMGIGGRHEPSPEEKLRQEMMDLVAAGATPDDALAIVRERALTEVGYDTSAGLRQEGQQLLGPEPPATIDPATGMMQDTPMAQLGGADVAGEVYDRPAQGAIGMEMPGGLPPIYAPVPDTREPEFIESAVPMGPEEMGPPTPGTEIMQTLPEIDARIKAQREEMQAVEAQRESDPTVTFAQLSDAGEGVRTVGQAFLDVRESYGLDQGVMHAADMASGVDIEGDAPADQPEEQDLSLGAVYDRTKPYESFKEGIAGPSTSEAMRADHHRALPGPTDWPWGIFNGPIERAFQATKVAKAKGAQEKAQRATNLLRAAERSQVFSLFGDFTQRYGRKVEDGGVEEMTEEPGMFGGPLPEGQTHRRVRTLANLGGIVGIHDVPGDYKVRPSQIFSNDFLQATTDEGIIDPAVTGEKWVRNLIGSYQSGTRHFQIDPKWLKQEVMGIEDPEELPSKLSQQNLIMISGLAKDSKDLVEILRKPEVQAFIRSGVYPAAGEWDKGGRISRAIAQSWYEDKDDANPLARFVNEEGAYAPFLANPHGYCQVAEQWRRDGRMEDLYKVRDAAARARDTQGYRRVATAINMATTGSHSFSVDAPKVLSPLSVRVWKNASEIATVGINGAFAMLGALSRQTVDIAAGDWDKVEARGDRFSSVFTQELYQSLGKWAFEELPMSPIGLAINIMDWAGADFDRSKMLELLVDSMERWEQRPVDGMLDMLIVGKFLTAARFATRGAFLGMSARPRGGFPTKWQQEVLAFQARGAPAGFMKGWKQGSEAFHQALSPLDLGKRLLKWTDDATSKRIMKLIDKGDQAALDAYLMKKNLTGVFEELSGALDYVPVEQNLNIFLDSMTTAFQGHGAGARNLVKRWLTSPGSHLMDDSKLLVGLWDQYKPRTMQQASAMMSKVDDFADQLGQRFGIGNQESTRLAMMMMDRQGKVAAAIRPYLRVTDSDEFMRLIKEVPEEYKFALPHDHIPDAGDVPYTDYMLKADKNVGAIREQVKKELLDAMPEDIVDEAMPGWWKAGEREANAERLADAMLTDATIDAIIYEPGARIDVWLQTGKRGNIGAADFLEVYRSTLLPIQQLTYETGWKLFNHPAKYIGKETLDDLVGGYMLRQAKGAKWKGLSSDITRTQSRVFGAERRVDKAAAKAAAFDVHEEMGRRGISFEKAQASGRAIEAEQLAAEAGMKRIGERLDALNELAVSTGLESDTTRNVMNALAGDLDLDLRLRLEKDFQGLAMPRQKARTPGALGTEGGADVYREYYELTRDVVHEHVQRTLRMRAYMDITDTFTGAGGEMAGTVQNLLSRTMLNDVDTALLRKYNIDIADLTSPGDRLKAAAQLLDDVGFINMRELGLDTRQAAVIKNMLTQKGWKGAKNEWHTPGLDKKPSHLDVDVWVSRENDALLQSLQSWNSSSIRRTTDNLIKGLKPIKRTVSNIKFNLVVATGLATFVRDFTTNMLIMGPRAGLKIRDTAHWRFGTQVHRYNEAGIASLVKHFELGDAMMMSEMGGAEGRALAKAFTDGAAGLPVDKSLGDIAKYLGRAAKEGAGEVAAKGREFGRAFEMAPVATTVGAAAKGAWKAAKPFVAPSEVEWIQRRLSRARGLTDSVPRMALFSKKVKDELGIDLAQFMEMQLAKRRTAYRNAKKAGKKKREASIIAERQMGGVKAMEDYFAQSPIGREFLASAGVGAEQVAARAGLMEHIYGRMGRLAEEAKTAFIRYDLKSPALAAVTEYGIVPFATYTARAVPMLADWAVRHPIKAVYYAHLNRALQYATWTLGAPTEALDAVMESWGQDRLLTPFPGQAEWQTLMAGAAETGVFDGNPELKQRLMQTGKITAPTLIDLTNFSPLAGVSGMNPMNSFLFTPLIEAFSGREAFPSQWEKGKLLPQAGGRQMVERGDKSWGSDAYQVFAGITGKYMPVWSGMPYWGAGSGMKKYLESGDARDLLPTKITTQHATRPAADLFEQWRGGSMRKLVRGGQAASARLAGVSMYPGSSHAAGLHALGGKFDGMMRVAKTGNERAGRGYDIFSRNMDSITDITSDMVKEMQVAIDRASPGADRDEAEARYERAKKYNKAVRERVRYTIDDLQTTMAMDFMRDPHNPASAHISGSAAQQCLVQVFEMAPNIRAIGYDFIETGEPRAADLDKEFLSRFPLSRGDTKRRQ